MRFNTESFPRLILGILIATGFSWGIASADDASWLTPASPDQILALFDTQAPFTAPFAPVAYDPGSGSWLNPGTEDQILSWGAKIAEDNRATIQPAATTGVPIAPIVTLVPYTLSKADLDRLLGNYKSGSNGNAPVNTITPVPTTTVVPSPVPTGDALHTADGTSIGLLMNRAMDSYRTNPNLPVAGQVTPIATQLPVQTPTGSTVDAGTGISLSGFSLQGRYVTISNTGITPVVMTGWKITNRQGNTLTFIDYPLGGGSTFTYVLYPGTTLTVYFGKDGVMSDSALYYPGGGSFWNAQGDTASLYNPQGLRVGSLTA
jgi:hypothetical protein